MEKRIIEVNGIKLEVDLSQCRVIENYKVGDNVKVLIKKYSDYESLPGVIVGFDNFENLPTIIIAYLKTSYSQAMIEFVYFNSQIKEVEICPMNEKDIPFRKQAVLDLIDAEIVSANEKAKDLVRRREFFLAEFGKYFEQEKVEQV